MEAGRSIDVPDSSANIYAAATNRTNQAKQGRLASGKFAEHLCRT